MLSVPRAMAWAEPCLRRAHLHTPKDANPPYASPLLTADLSRLPPALILTSSAMVGKGRQNIGAEEKVEIESSHCSGSCCGGQQFQGAVLVLFGHGQVDQDQLIGLHFPDQCFKATHHLPLRADNGALKHPQNLLPLGVPSHGCVALTGSGGGEDAGVSLKFRLPLRQPHARSEKPASDGFVGYGREPWCGCVGEGW